MFAEQPLRQTKFSYRPITLSDESQRLLDAGSHMSFYRFSMPLFGIVGEVALN